jgi:hypothetical protein
MGLLTPGRCGDQESRTEQVRIVDDKRRMVLNNGRIVCAKRRTVLNNGRIVCDKRRIVSGHPAGKAAQVAAEASRYVLPTNWTERRLRPPRPGRRPLRAACMSFRPPRPNAALGHSA